MEELKLLIQYGANFGIGGILAGIMFYFYRQDRQKSEALAQNFKEIITNNTQAMTKLESAITSR